MVFTGRLTGIFQVQEKLTQSKYYIVNKNLSGEDNRVRSKVNKERFVRMKIKGNPISKTR